MQRLTIGDIARSAGVQTSAIRYYERIGLLPPAQRVNGKRRYDSSALQKLNVIRLAQRAGFSIAEIQTLLHEFPQDMPPSARWQSLASRKIVELDAQMNEIQAMKILLVQTLRCQCATLEDCASLEDEKPGVGVCP